MYSFPPHPTPHQGIALVLARTHEHTCEVALNHGKPQLKFTDTLCQMSVARKI